MTRQEKINRIAQEARDSSDTLLFEILELLTDAQVDSFSWMWDDSEDEWDDDDDYDEWEDDDDEW